MFLFERKIPLIVAKCEALIRNLPPNHPKINDINNELSKQLAGYYGEQAIDYHLAKLDQEKYDIIPGIRLKNKDRYFQIDALVLSNCFWIAIEIKNLTGELQIDHSKGQLTQNKNGFINVYDNPISQAQHQQMQLIQWLKEKKIVSIPIDFLVTFSNSNGNVKSIHGHSNHFWKVCRGINIFEKIAMFEKIHQTEFITTKERRRLAKILIKHNEPLNIDVVQRFKIPNGDLPPRVRCPICLSRPMVFTYGTWHCSICGARSKTAHEQKLQDYFLLNGPTINNQQFREITLIKQRTIATRILNKMDLEHQGSNKGRTYFPPKK